MGLRLFLLGVGVGAVAGTKGKDLLKSAAKGYLALEEKTKALTADMREDVRDAIEEARYEREQETADAEEGLQEPEAQEEAQAAPKKRPRRGSSSNRAGANAKVS